MSDTSIRLTEETKRRLELRKHGEESFEAVIERLLDEDRDLLAGFGAWEDTDKASAARDTYDRSRDNSRERLKTIDEVRARREAELEKAIDQQVEAQDKEAERFQEQLKQQAEEMHTELDRQAEELDEDNAETTQ
jgi:predicted CopG family antitoxin